MTMNVNVFRGNKRYGGCFLDWERDGEKYKGASMEKCKMHKERKNDETDYE